MNESSNEFKLSDCPNDCVQSVKFGPKNLLLSASWDQTVRLYDVSTNTMKGRYLHTGPVLDVCFQGGDGAEKCWSGGLDKCLKMYDFESSIEQVIGQHREPIRCLENISDLQLVASGGWDAMVNLWDTRTQSLAGSHQQPDKVYAMAVCGNNLIVGTAERRILVWDVRKMDEPLQKRESTLRFQTRCIKTFPNKEGYVVSSIEGRVAVEYFDQSPEVQKKKYAFKCHRQKDASQGLETIYPVNAIAFHSVHNTFATGGSDGYVSMWDGFNKKRICLFHKYPTSISSLCFSPDGTYLAIASSCMYENPATTSVPPDSIYIRKVTDQETRPK